MCATREKKTGTMNHQIDVIAERRHIYLSNVEGKWRSQMSMNVKHARDIGECELSFYM